MDEFKLYEEAVRRGLIDPSITFATCLASIQAARLARSGTHPKPSTEQEHYVPVESSHTDEEKV